ncbi:MAG: GAF domain-containing protein [Cellulomonas sp.]|nr:GAF domain-containing protein [Cellulomonas sp.]
MTDHPDVPDPIGDDGLDELMDAILAIAGELDLAAVLDRLVQAASTITKAGYAAINVLDDRGASTTFVHRGIGAALAHLIGSSPHARGVLGQIPIDGAIRLDDLTQHPAFRGWPEHHPAMGAFLGASVRVGERIFGQIYLADKPGGFTQQDEERVLRLAATAAVAVNNAQLYAGAERRERWLHAGQDITTMLLEGADEEEALEQIVRMAREIAGADTAALVLPGLSDALLIELADGYDADRLLGQVMPKDGRTAAVMSEGRGLLTPSLSASRTVRVEAMRAFGPAMYAPMQTAGRGVGVLILMRRIGAQPFTEADLVTAESFAAQAALAFVLAEARHAQDVAALLDERERIARDLHDLAIQQLFATGMQLETVRRRAARGVDPHELTEILEEALDNVDGSVREIRQIVHALRDPDAATSMVERLRREASLARTGLGFAPSLVLSLDGRSIGEGDTGEGLVLAEDVMDDRVAPQLSDDVVAVVREGLANAARHAHASSVIVRVSVNGAGATGTVSVEVQDDGRGLPEHRARHSGTGNLASRARQNGGTFSLGAATDGRGALLSWQAPLA